MDEFKWMLIFDYMNYSNFILCSELKKKVSYIDDFDYSAKTITS